jgi:hypothetical protein
MPRLSVWFIRAALLYLALGFTLGMLLLANKGVLISPTIWQLLPAHIEFLLLGWTVQLALGVAFWILPRWQTQRGDVRGAYLAFFLLNLGIWCVVLAPWLDLWRTTMLDTGRSIGPAAAWGVGSWLLTFGRACEAAAAGTFALHAWPRVKPWVETP